MSRNKVILFYGMFYPSMGYDWVPWGPIFVYSLLKDAGFEPILIHEFKDRDYEHIIRDNANELLFFGVSAMSGHQITSALKAIQILKKYNKDVPTVWGGAHATAVPQNTLEHPSVDYVYTGFAKGHLIRFAKTLQAGKDIGGIPDVLSKQRLLTSNLSTYQIEDYKNDYDAFPKLYLEDFDFSYLVTQNKVINYTTSTGCPGQCSFCSWGGKHTWSHLHTDKILDDLEYLKDRYGLRSIWLSDASLTPRRDFITGLAQGMLDRDLDLYWRCCGRIAEIKNISSEDFRLLEAAGLDLIFIGTESTNRESMRLFNKIYKTETLTEILQTVSPFQIRIILAFIFGIPDAPIKEIFENSEQIKIWKAVNSKVNYDASFYTPYPGTPLTDRAIQLGYKPPQTLDEFGTQFNQDNRSCGSRRDNIHLPWFSQEKRDAYVHEYYKVFPDTDEGFLSWEWREKVKDGASLIIRTHSQARDKIKNCPVVASQ